MEWRATYEWNPGSVPPPHYWEILISVGSDGAGSLECRPDHAFTDPPTWRWTFVVSRDHISTLNTALREGQDPAATAGGPPHLGGAAESVTVTRNGSVDHLAASPELTFAIRSAVPDQLWIALRDRRTRYVEDSSS